MKYYFLENHHENDFFHNFFIFMIFGADEVSNGDLRRVTDAFWEWKIREFPEFATADGLHQHDDKLESFSLKNMDNRKVRVCKR